MIIRKGDKLNPQFLYYMFLSTLAASSFWFFSKALIGTSLPGRSIGSRYNRYSILSKYKRGKKEVDNTGSTGNFPTPLYQIIRIILFGLWFIAIVVLKIAKGFPSFNMHLIIVTFLFIATMSRQKIYNLKLPLFYIRNFTRKRKKQILNKEIYRTISQMVNLFTVKRGMVMGSNYIFDEIIKFSKATRPIYYHMLSIWNMNKRDEAADYFARAIGTKEAGDLAFVFLKLDYLSPGELKNQLIHYQNNMRSEKITMREKINERNGNLMYVLAIISAIVVLLNFLVIVLVVEVFSSYSQIFS